MDFKRVGTIDESPIYKRGDWYFAKNPEGNWCKLIFDFTEGKKLSYLLEKDLSEMKEEPGELTSVEFPPFSIKGKGEAMDIEPL